MAPFKCILCGSTPAVITDTIDTKKLAILYKERAKIDVSRFFSQPNIFLCSCLSCGLKFYMPQAIGDSDFYDKLQYYNDYYMDEKAEFREAARWISKTDEVLEIGCGSGNFTNFIHCKAYTGLEFSDSAIQKAKENGVTVISQDISQHAILHPGKYDVVCFFQVLEHVESPNQFLKDSIVCLKPGGKLIFAVPNEDSFINKAVNFYLNMPPHHASRYTDKVFKKIAALNNLTLVHMFHEPLNSNHRLFYAKTRIYNRLTGLVKAKPKSIDFSLGNKVLYSIAYVLAHALSPVFMKNERTIGQSVLAVYNKDATS